MRMVWVISAYRALTHADSLLMLLAEAFDGFRKVHRRRQCVQYETPLEAHAKALLNLRAYCERMRQRYYSTA